VIFVLLVEPEIAVHRKTTEPPYYWAARARIVGETDWTGTGAHLVDASQHLAQVVAELKTLIWSAV